MTEAETDYLIDRATAQLALARRAELRRVATVHLEMSSRYLSRALALIDAERRHDRRDTVVSIKR